jgi:hypothetical protein
VKSLWGRPVRGADVVHIRHRGASECRCLYVINDDGDFVQWVDHAIAWSKLGVMTYPERSIAVGNLNDYEKGYRYLHWPDHCEWVGYLELP